MTKRTWGLLAVERLSDRECLKQVQFSVAAANSSYLVKKTRKKNKVEAGIFRDSDTCCVSFDLRFVLFRKASEKLKDGRAQLFCFWVFLSFVFFFLFYVALLSSIIKSMSMKILGLE